MSAAVLARSRPCGGPALHATVASAAALGAALAFFAAHGITAPYYLLPSAAGALDLLAFAFAWCEAEPPRPSSASFPALAALAVAAALATVVAAGTQRPEAVASSGARDALAPGSIVWADMLSGSLLYYDETYAAKLPFADPCTRYRLVKGAADRGLPQVFVLDSQVMRDAVAALADPALAACRQGLAGAGVQTGMSSRVRSRPAAATRACASCSMGMMSSARSATA